MARRHEGKNCARLQAPYLLRPDAPHKPNCWIASLPEASSAKKMPSTQIMAKRPLLISLLRMSVSYILKPSGSPKLPGMPPSFSRQSNSMTPESQKTPKKPMAPSAVPMAPRPAGVFSKPGNLMKCWPRRPTDAIIATRPCLISEARNLSKPCSSPTFVNPSGSKKPRGAVAPTCSDGWKGGGGGGTASSAATVAAAARATRRGRPARSAARAPAATTAALALRPAMASAAPAKLLPCCTGAGATNRGAGPAGATGARKAASASAICEGSRSTKAGARWRCCAWDAWAKLA
mmetsp:Transcript_38769/g.78218  ORF Transcript_38769/g.78218 Transcript_38769/m.78218 type:complete len:291 (-) Transcript_38769:18-890(-)